MNYLSKVAGIGLATTMALAMQSSARAFDFSFTLDDGTDSVTGTIFGLQNNATSSPSSIEITSGGFGTYPSSGGTFTVAGNSIVSSNYSASASAAPASLRLSDINGFRYNDMSRGMGGKGALFDSDDNPQYSAVGGATSVPFGVKTDLSILILGGLYGVSRIRKTLSAR